MSDWSLATWIVEGVVMLGVPQSGPGSDHVECRQLARVGGQLPKWMNRGPSQSELRRQLWKVEEPTVKVQMSLEKVWDDSAERWRVGRGGVWPVEAICVMVEGEERWVLDELRQSSVSRPICGSGSKVWMGVMSRGRSGSAQVGDLERRRSRSTL